MVCWDGINNTLTGGHEDTNAVILHNHLAAKNNKLGFRPYCLRKLNSVLAKRFFASNSVSNAAPHCPDQLANVERGVCTFERALMASSR